MLGQKPVLGWNSWNTFGASINERLILEIADTMVEKGYKSAGYEYLIIDDCWAQKERINGKLEPDPELFPHGMKYVADYVHSKGLKFGMYSCAGVRTCSDYPSSYGYEFEDAKQFASWGVDYLKYDFCHFPTSGNAKNAYITMAMALRNSGRDILFAACNWGVENPSEWMRSRGAHTYRSTGDIFDNPTSFKDIFKSQLNNVEHNAPGCYNDMDMLIVGMHGNGNVGLSGCSDDEYLAHFALWAFLGSPLIIGGDIRNMSDINSATLLNKGLISINQDDDARPPFILRDGKMFILARLLSGGRFAFLAYNADETDNWSQTFSVAFDDIGIRSNTPRKVKLTNALTDEEVGTFSGSFSQHLDLGEIAVYIGEVVE